MGRKTWESIPEKFRPLKGRLNIVISRSFPSSPPSGPPTEEGVIKLNSLEAVLGFLRSSSSHPADHAASSGKIFVIGGGEIYAAALRLKEARRVLLTSVLNEFDCDTYFPIKLGAGEDGKDTQDGWEQCAKEALDEWTGEEVPVGVQEENGTKYEFQMWEKRE